VLADNPLWLLGDLPRRAGGERGKDKRETERVGTPSDIGQAQPVHGAGEAVSNQRAVDAIPRIETAQVFAGLCVADVPRVVIPGGALKVGMMFAHKIDE